MRVRVSHDGFEKATNAEIFDMPLPDEFDLPPNQAALAYCNQQDVRFHSAFLIVTPLDDEADALSVWGSDDDGRFVAFVGNATPAWTIRQTWPELAAIKEAS